MKRMILAFGLATAVTLTAKASVIVSSFNDIEYWVGTGANQAGLVIDFHDGAAEQSFAWGFRWDGVATGYDMLTAIDAASVELSINSPSYVMGVSFQGLAHTQTTNFFDTSWGYYLAGGTATIFDSNPPYGPVGILSPPGGGSNIPTSWTISTAGSSDRQLANGSWDALSFGANQVSGQYLHLDPPSSVTYAAVPEPSTLALAFLALPPLIYARKRLHAG
ncbi:MAG: hypothetical protein WCO94_00455 [Verrucomicrobiota bacterium]